MYGESGSGKTTFWATFPGPILAVVCSGSRQPGELRSVNTAEYKKKISEFVLTDSMDLTDLLAYLRDEGGKFKTIVLDHVSGFTDLVIKEVVGLQEIPAMKHWGMAEQQQYGQVAQKVTTYLRDLISLPANIIVVGQERVFKAKDDGVVSDVIRPVVGVGTMPSIAAWLNPACDYILQAFKRTRTETITVTVGGKSKQVVQPAKGVEYCLRTEPHEYFTTKFRIPKGRKLPDVIADPTYEKLLAAIRGEG